MPVWRPSRAAWGRSAPPSSAPIACASSRRTRGPPPGSRSCATRGGSSSRARRPAPPAPPPRWSSRPSSPAARRRSAQRPRTPPSPRVGPRSPRGRGAPVTAETPLPDGPLSGLRVVEFGQLIAGPYVGTLLADFGADVIKVEAPPKGDALREWGQHKHNGHSLWWSVMARGKRSVALNLRTEDCQQRALELCATADVVVENFRPGTMEKWGLGPEDVHALNPGCVYARISGYGQTGRYRDRPGFASAGEALGGLRYINGYPGQAPPRPGISLGDTLAAQSAFQGIVLALYARDARGATGQVVDASITDACFAMMESTVLEYEKTGTIRRPTGTRLPRIAPSNVYLSKDDKWVVIA